jgi:hypothetical protein
MSEVGFGFKITPNSRQQVQQPWLLKQCASIVVELFDLIQLFIPILSYNYMTLL